MRLRFGWLRPSSQSLDLRLILRRSANTSMWDKWLGRYISMCIYSESQRRCPMPKRLMRSLGLTQLSWASTAISLYGNRAPYLEGVLSTHKLTLGMASLQSSQSAQLKRAATQSFDREKYWWAGSELTWQHIARATPSVTLHVQNFSTTCQKRCKVAYQTKSSLNATSSHTKCSLTSSKSFRISCGTTWQLTRAGVFKLVSDVRWAGEENYLEKFSRLTLRLVCKVCICNGEFVKER